MPNTIVIPPEPVNILLVDDQPAKLLSYEVVLAGLGENLIKATSAREALEHLLKTDIAVILVDVQMPEMDGFELAQMIREHPRFRQTAIIFVSAIHLSEIDRLRGYEAGAVDYVPVPVVPEVLRAKVRVFAELYRKTRDLERLNEELERRVVERTAELEASAARLRESEERRTVALAAGQMGAWDWDLVTGAVGWDAGQYRIFGLEPGTGPLTFESVRPHVHPEDLDLIQGIAAEAALGQRTFQVEARLVRPDGEIRWCICAGAVTADEAGQVARVSGVTIDITERKRAEQALQTMNEDLERRIEDRTREREHALAQLFEAQKLDTIGQLTGGVAHDFNNLLMAVLGSLQLLRKRLPEDPRALRLLENAVQGAERGAALTQRLLAFARRQELKPEAVDVGRLVSSMEDLLKRALGPTVRIAKSLPSDVAPVRADANQLELALLNLAINARDAMPLGGALAVAASNETLDDAEAAQAGVKPGSYVRISVADNGIGMDAATLAKATEPFFTTKGPGKGTGLGLSMVHGLAAQSGGVLRVSSEVGKGTNVELWLPQAADRAANAGARKRREIAKGEAPQVLPHTILLVDDDVLVATGTAAMLEDLGHTVIEAHSAAQALEVLRGERRVEIVITDHAMPGMTGLQLVRQLEVEHPGLPVILATGYAEWPAGQEAEIRVPRLAKPFKQEELAAAIAAVADKVVPADNVVPIRAADRA